jgi:hypothetical protein
VCAARVEEIVNTSDTVEYKIDTQEEKRLSETVEACRKKRRRESDASVIDHTPRKTHRSTVDRDGKRRATKFTSPVFKK